MRLPLVYVNVSSLFLGWEHFQTTPKSQVNATVLSFEHWAHRI